MIKSCYANLNIGKTKSWDKNQLLAYIMSTTFVRNIWHLPVDLGIHFQDICVPFWAYVPLWFWERWAQCWLLCRWVCPCSVGHWICAPQPLCSALQCPQHLWQPSLRRQCLLILVHTPAGIWMSHWVHCRVLKYRKELCVFFWGGETKLPDFTHCCLQESYLVLDVLPRWGSKPVKSYVMGLLQHPRNHK